MLLNEYLQIELKEFIGQANTKELRDKVKLKVYEVLKRFLPEVNYDKINIKNENGDVKICLPKDILDKLNESTFDLIKDNI